MSFKCGFENINLYCQSSVLWELYSILYGVEGASSPVSDVDTYVIIKKFLGFIFNILPVFTYR
jgi:hypothetical protein